MLNLADVEWKREWFSNLPKTYWISVDNQKKFLEEIKVKLNVNHPSDWGKIQLRKIYALGGRTLLKYYRGSLFTCLQSIYTGISNLDLLKCTDIKWKKEWFSYLPHYPKSHWKSRENCKIFLDELARKLNIKSPRDWGKVTIREFHRYGGSALLTLYHNSSLFSCLQSVYKGIESKRRFLACRY